MKKTLTEEEIYHRAIENFVFESLDSAINLSDLYLIKEIKVEVDVNTLIKRYFRRYKLFEKGFDFNKLKSQYQKDKIIGNLIWALRNQDIKKNSFIYDKNEMDRIKDEDLGYKIGGYGEVFYGEVIRDILYIKYSFYDKEEIAFRDSLTIQWNTKGEYIKVFEPKEETKECVNNILDTIRKKIEKGEESIDETFYIDTFECYKIIYDYDGNDEEWDDLETTDEVMSDVADILKSKEYLKNVEVIAEDEEVAFQFK